MPDAEHTHTRCEKKMAAMAGVLERERASKEDRDDMHKNELHMVQEVVNGRYLVPYCTVCSFVRSFRPFCCLPTAILVRCVWRSRSVKKWLSHTSARGSSRAVFVTIHSVLVVATVSCFDSRRPYESTDCYILYHNKSERPVAQALQPPLLRTVESTHAVSI